MSTPKKLEGTKIKRFEKSVLLSSFSLVLAFSNTQVRGNFSVPHETSSATTSASAETLRIRKAVKNLAEANPNPDYSEAIDAYRIVVSSKPDALYEIVRYAERLSSSKATETERGKRLMMLAPALAVVSEDCSDVLVVLSGHSSDNVRFLCVYACQCLKRPRPEVAEKRKSDPSLFVRRLATWFLKKPASP